MILLEAPWLQHLDLLIPVDFAHASLRSVQPSRFKIVPACRDFSRSATNSQPEEPDMTTDGTPPEHGDPARLIREALLRELLREVAHDGRIATRLEHVSCALIDKGTGGDV